MKQTCGNRHIVCEMSHTNDEYSYTSLTQGVSQAEGNNFK